LRAAVCLGGFTGFVELGRRNRGGRLGPPVRLSRPLTEGSARVSVALTASFLRWEAGWDRGGTRPPAPPGSLRRTQRSPASLGDAAPPHAPSRSLRSTPCPTRGPGA